MSSINLHFELIYQDEEHARLVFEAFSQWPTSTIRKKKPDARRLTAIKRSMDWLGYEFNVVYQHAFEKQNAILEKPPIKEDCTVELVFYCSKLSGNQFFHIFFEELSALPVTIMGHLYNDMDGYTESKIVKISETVLRKTIS